MAAVLFQEAVDKIVETDGPNAITRASLLTGAERDHLVRRQRLDGCEEPQGRVLRLHGVIQVENGEFVRATPTEKGKLDCNPDYLTTVTLDPTVEAQKIQ